MIKVMKRVKKLIKDSAIKFNFYMKLRMNSGAEPRIFYLMGLGNRFPNLGDQAQATAIPLWFKKHFPMQVIEIKNDQIYQCLPLLKKHIKNNDIVFLHSGGNFGDDWYQTQLDREAIITCLKNNKIIQLPQTIFYSNSALGKQVLKHSQQVIQAHPSLLLFGRDFQSTALANQIFPITKVYARPDMVLSLQDVVSDIPSFNNTANCVGLKKTLLILRNDKEGIYNNSIKQEMAKSLSDIGYETTIWDTDVDDFFPDGKKLITIIKYLRFIASFDAVVTDRYHGLIFSVLVKKPCVVMRTHNHKLTSAFDWFDEVNFTRRADNIEDVKNALSDLEKLTEYSAPDWNEKHFDPMAKEVKDFLEYGS